MRQTSHHTLRSCMHALTPCAVPNMMRTLCSLCVCLQGQRACSNGAHLRCCQRIWWPPKPCSDGLHPDLWLLSSPSQPAVHRAAGETVMYVCAVHRPHMLLTSASWGWAIRVGVGAHSSALIRPSSVHAGRLAQYLTEGAVRVVPPPESCRLLAPSWAPCWWLD